METPNETKDSSMVPEASDQNDLILSPIVESCSTQSPLNNNSVNVIIDQNSDDENAETPIILNISDVNSQDCHENTPLVENDENGITRNESFTANEEENAAPKKISKSTLPDKEYFKSIFSTENRAKKVEIDFTSPIKDNEKISICSRASLESLEKRGRDLDKAFSAGNVIDKSARDINDLATFLELRRLKQNKNVQRSNDNDEHCDKNLYMGNKAIQANLLMKNTYSDDEIETKTHQGSRRVSEETHRSVDCNSQLMEFENRELSNTHNEEFPMTSEKIMIDCSTTLGVMDSGTTLNSRNNTSLIGQQPLSPILSIKNSRSEQPGQIIDIERIKRTIFEKIHSLQKKDENELPNTDNEKSIVSPELNAMNSNVMLNSRNNPLLIGELPLSPILSVKKSRSEQTGQIIDIERIKKTIFEKIHSSRDIDESELPNTDNEESFGSPELNAMNSNDMWNSSPLIGELPFSPILSLNNSPSAQTRQIIDIERIKKTLLEKINSLQKKDENDLPNTDNEESLVSPMKSEKIIIDDYSPTSSGIDSNAILNSRNDASLSGEHLSPDLSSSKRKCDSSQNNEIENKRIKKTLFDERIDSLLKKDHDDEAILSKRTVGKLRAVRIKKKEKSLFGNLSQGSMSIDETSVIETQLEIADNDSLHIETISSQVENEESKEKMETGLFKIEPAVSQTDVTEAHPVFEQSQLTLVEGNEEVINSSDEDILISPIKTRKRKYDENHLVSRFRNIQNRCNSQQRMWAYEMRAISQSTDTSDWPVFIVKELFTCDEQTFMKCHRDDAIDPDNEYCTDDFSLPKSFYIICGLGILNKRIPGDRFKIHPHGMILEHENEIFLLGGTRLELVSKSELSVIDVTKENANQSLRSAKEDIEKCFTSSDTDSPDENKKINYNLNAIMKCFRDMVSPELHQSKETHFSTDDWDKNLIENNIVEIKDISDFDNAEGLIRRSRLFRFFVPDFFIIGTVAGWGHMPEQSVEFINLQGEYYILLSDSSKDVCALILSTEDELSRWKSACQVDDLSVLSDKKYKVSGFEFTYRMPVERCSWIRGGLPKEFSELKFMNFLTSKTPIGWNCQLID